MSKPLVTEIRGTEVLTASNFADWCKIMSDRFVPLKITADFTQSDFSGTVISRVFGDIHVSLVSADAHRVRRLPESIHPNEKRFIKLSLQLSGTSTYTQDGRVAEIQPDDLVVYDTSHPYAMDADGPIESFIVMMPPSALSLSRAALDRITALRMAPTSMVGECAQPFMRQFVRRFEQLSEQDGARLIRAFIGLVDAMLHAELSNLAPEATDFDHILDYIQRHLGEFDLSPTRIASDNFVSLRTLHYLFQDRGTTVSLWIRSERLHRCCLDLANPALATESIAQIAARWGFPVAASFNRLFKQEFGKTPGDWRRDELVLQP